MKLELKKKDDDGSTFYRYREDDCLIWFSQYDNGNIYRVNIQGNDGIEYFAVEDETYSPKEFYYTVPRTTISSMKEFDEFNKKIQSAEELRCFLRRFFAESEHGKLYFNQHNIELGNGGIEKQLTRLQDLIELKLNRKNSMQNITTKRKFGKNYL